MTVSINGTSGLVFNDGSTQATAGYVPFRNRIINGAMMIDQRNAGASVTLGAGNVYTLDRFAVQSGSGSKLSAQQNAGSVTPPAGFRNYFGLTSLSAYAVPAGEVFSLRQYIEGFNVADLNWGTASAATVTLSFWVRSSLTGTFGGAVNNNSNRSYPFTYTISAANTWEQKSITIAGDTSGTWATGNTTGLLLEIGLGVGSTFSGTAGAWTGSYFASATGATSVVGTNGATFYITGVQLEKGSTATSFDYRPYGTELALCQRYFLRAGTASLGRWYTSSQSELTITFPVEMRVTPSVSHLANYSIFEVGTATRTVTNTVLNTDETYTTRGTFVNTSGSSGATAGNLASPVQSNIGLSAEL